MVPACTRHARTGRVPTPRTRAVPSPDTPRLHGVCAKLCRMGPLRRALVPAAIACTAWTAPAAALAPPPLRDGHGLTVAGVEQRSPRLFAVTLTTPELTAPTRVWILLPDGYDANPRKRYPVLYLFHGTSGGAADWVQQGDAEATTAGRDLITVMPDAGVDGDGGGYFADWVNGGKGGPPRWETHHVRDLIPWVDANLRTRAARSGRAIAGLSQGGYGAFSYAARHPDRFAAAAAFSAPLDSSADPEAAGVFTAVVTVTETTLNGDPPGTIFGDRAADGINWAAHDPATLAANLRGMRLFVLSGDGRPGPFDTAPNPAGTAIEAGAFRLTELFIARLRAASIPVEYHPYGPGTHTWPYWARDLRDVIGPLTDELAHPRPAPARIDYTSDAATFTQWGWRVAMRRDVRELASLQDAGRRGFTLAGSGTGVVRTPKRYRRRQAVVVRLKGPAVDARRRLRAGPGGRLTVEVPLGPSNTRQQFTAGAQTTVRSTVVTLRPVTPATPRKRRR